MKIGFLTPEYPHPKTGSSGGIGTGIFNLAKGLIQLGNQVTIIVFGQDTDESFVEGGITFYKVKNPKFKGFSFFLTQKKLQRLINKLYVEYNIEIIEAPDWIGITSFINSKCPIVLRLNGSDTYFCHLDKRPVKWINKYHEKKALKQADGIISVSEFTAQITNKIFNLSLNYKVIPNSINVNNFESRVKKEDPVILYFGTLIRKKGLLELPSIFNKVYAQNSSARLVLVGKDAGDIISGNESTWKMMLPLFNDDALHNVSYLGVVPYTEIKEQIEKATLCVFPTFAEALPVSWLEAMAMKKPIVASNIGWAKEIIDNGVDGFLVHPKSHTEFADSIVEILKNVDLQKKMGNAARVKVEKNFSQELIAEKSEIFYSQILFNNEKN
jgi:glycosyltransferase involved in cell wall biosynthesis